MAQVALLKTIQEGIAALEKNPAEALRKAREVTQAYVTNADPTIKSVAISLDRAIINLQANQSLGPITEPVTEFRSRPLSESRTASKKEPTQIELTKIQKEKSTEKATEKAQKSEPTRGGRRTRRKHKPSV